MANLLPMFFDEEFVPHAYLDALFDQSSTSNKSDLTSLKQIKLLQQRTTMLLSNLDFYTNELTTELEEKISTLEQSNLIISYTYDQQGEGRRSSLSNKDSAVSKLTPTTRLEYYIDSLSISINSLNDQIGEVSSKLTQITSSEDKTNDTTTKLLKLTKSKESLQKVANALEVIRSITEINDTSITSIPSTTQTTRSAPTNSKTTSKTSDPLSIQPSDFNASLDVLKANITEQFKKSSETESKTDINKELLNKVDGLIQLLPCFKNLGQFYSSYAVFSKVLQSEKTYYLENKNLDNKDELFQEVLR